MSATQRQAPSRQLTEAPGYLRADSRCSEAREIAALFREVAVTCVQKQTTRLLIIVDDDPAGQRALRDALTVMVLAGIPSQFRLAIVAASDRASVAYRQAQRDFCAAEVTTRLFDSETDAATWLTSTGASGTPEKFTER